MSSQLGETDKRQVEYFSKISHSVTITLKHLNVGASLTERVLDTESEDLDMSSSLLTLAM